MYVYTIFSLLLIVYGHSNGFVNLPNILKTNSRLHSSMKDILDSKSRHVLLLDNRLTDVLSEQQNTFDTFPLGRSAVRAVVTIRRLAKDWAEIATLIGRYTALSNLGLGQLRWPENNDVKAAARALYRIQTTYTEESNALSLGNILQNYSNSGVTALDCFNIALQHYKNWDPSTADWLQVSLEKIRNGDISVPKELVLAYKAVERGSKGNYLSSASVLSAMLKDAPKYNLPASLVQEFHSIVYRGCSSELDFPDYEYEAEELIHKALCKAPQRVMDGLVCRYVHYQQRHLRFQPFKLEELQLDPPVLRFYNVVTENEVESLKEISRRRMKKAETLTTNGKSEVSEYRTSHVAWVDPEETNMTQTLQRRIADVTRMNLKFAEPHQISRYDIGGEYKPHRDIFGFTHYEYDRFATLMFYLNDVTRGGNTVFLNWNLTVAPVKNSAVLWFHFFPRGEVDLSTVHSGCPVIEGEKWVMNKWTHNIGNEFVFPCGLNKNESYMKYYL